MIGRRGFLQLGPAALSGSLAIHWGNAIGAAATGKPHSLAQGIVDERYTESRTFGDSLAAHGVPTTAIRGDVASLWYDDLRAQLRRTRTPVAGLTDRCTLFCLEELARDVSMKVVTRIDHIIDRNGNARHDAIGPGLSLETIQSLHPQERFGHLVALLVMQPETFRGAHLNAQKRTGPAAPANDTALALVTWVIA